ncbi:MAG TPA: peptide deformylase [bacterium]|nr:peptide deformylase [bacterium]
MAERVPARGLPIVTVDSPRAAILRRRAQPVRAMTRDTRTLIEQMFETLRHAHGVGLAAPQVGVGRRVIVIEVADRRHALVDPEVLKQEGEAVATEACLSIPGLLGDVPRATHVVVRARNRRNRFITVDAQGLLARVLQHEIDHLDGILFTDRVRDPKTLRQAGGEATEVAPEGDASAVDLLVSGDAAP